MTNEEYSKRGLIIMTVAGMICGLIIGSIITDLRYDSERLTA